MTAVACWYRKTTDSIAKSIWCVADTRLSSEADESGHRREIANEGPKAFVLSVAAHRFDGLQRAEAPPAFVRRVGYAYAGSTTMGMSVAHAAAGLLGALEYSEVPPPTFEDVANLIARVTWRYTKSIVFAEPATKLRSLVFGFCPRTNEPRIAKIDVADLTLEGPHVATPEDLADESRVVLLGSGAAAVGESIARRRAEASPDSTEWWTAPFRAVEEVASGGRSDVGGALQVVVAENNDRVRFFGTYSEPDRRRLYLGMDLDDSLGRVGEWSPVVPIFGSTVPAKHLEGEEVLDE